MYQEEGRKAVWPIQLPDGGRLTVTDSDLVPMGEVWCHRQVTYARPADDDGPACEIVFEIRSGVPMCTSVRLWSDDGGVQYKDVKNIPIERLVHDAFTTAGVYRPNPDGEGYVTLRDTVLAANSIGSSRFNRDRKSVEKATSRRPITDKLLKEVAEVHRNAPEGHKTAAVVNAFSVKTRMAQEYIGLARARKFLAQSERSQKGRKK